MTKILTASNAKAHFYKLIEGVHIGDEIIVTKNGKPTIAMLSAEELSSLRETLDVLSDPELMRQIRHSERQLRTGRRRYPLEAVLREPTPAYSSKKARRKR